MPKKESEDRPLEGPPAEIARRMREVIEESETNQTRFARYIGYSPPAIGKMLKATFYPSFYVLVRFLEIFESVNTDWLIFERGEKYKEGRGAGDNLSIKRGSGNVLGRHHQHTTVPVSDQECQHKLELALQEIRNLKLLLDQKDVVSAVKDRELTRVERELTRMEKIIQLLEDK